MVAFLGETHIKTLLVSDLVGSTAMVEALGDMNAAKVIAQHDRMARDLMRDYDGREIDKSDGFLLMFEQPVAAISYALAYHDALETMSREIDFVITARSAIHLGEVILWENHPDDVARGAKPIEIEGVAKPLTARVMSIAKGRQCLMTRAAYEPAYLSAPNHEALNGLVWCEHGPYMFKGISQPVDVFEVGRKGLSPLTAPDPSGDVVREAPTVDSKSPEPLPQALSEMETLIPVDRPMVRTGTGEGAIGQQIGPYTIKRPLGRGGMGSVYLAMRDDEELRMPVSIKLIREDVSNPQMVEHFLKERQLLAELRHPHISMIFDAGSTDDGIPYLIMEYIPGAALTTWCETNKPSLTYLIRMFQKILSALGFAHNEGIIHRDIKPSNILVTPQGEPKLLDFGIAYLIGNEKVAMPDRNALTPEYAAPEQMRGEALSRACDIYAVGLLMLETLTGQRPSEWKHKPQAMVRELLGSGTITSSDLNSEEQGRTQIPEQLGQLMRRALSPDPTARFDNAQAMYDALDMVLAGIFIKTAAPDLSRSFEVQHKTFDALVWYHGDDQELACELAEDLVDQEDFKIWLDLWNQAPDKQSDHETATAMDRARTVLVCIGPSGQMPWGSQNIATTRLETLSEFGELEVIPVLLQGASYPEKLSKLPGFLEGRQWVDLNTGQGSEMVLLVDSLRGEVTQYDSDLRSQECPFRGLEAFREEDAHFFYGREALTQRLLHNARENAFTAVLGPSGSGKSSLVQAGLMPKLRTKGYHLLLVTPGQNPLDELVFALNRMFKANQDSLQSVIPPTEQLANRILASNKALHYIIREFIEDTDAVGVFLMIDQFEEVFTLSEANEARDAFVQALTYAAVQAEPALSTVITMRSDFIGKCTQWSDLSNLVSDYVLQVGPMSRRELERAIEKPAAQVGLRLERGLLSRILGDLSGAAIELPLMEHALLELYERRQGALLRSEAYDEIGGIEGALAKRAESEYSALDKDGQDVLRKMFVLALVHPGEAAEDTRRRATEQELLTAGGNEALSRELSQRWVGARLLTSAYDSRRKLTMYDVAHEALIRRWARIGDWMQDGRETARKLQQLRQQAKSWQESGRQEDYLLRRAPLARMVDLYEQDGITLSTLERAFVEAGIEARDRHEKVLAERRREELRLAKRKTMVTLLVAGTFITMLALFTMATLKQKNELDEAHKETLEQMEVAEAVQGAMKGMFEDAKPKDGSVTGVADLLIKGEERLEGLEDKPKAQLELQLTLGNTYLMLEPQYADRSLPLLNNALEHALEIYGPNHIKAVGALRALAEYHIRKSAFPEALVRIDKAITALRTMADKDAKLMLANSLTTKANIHLLSNQLEAAEKAQGEAVEINKQLRPNDVETINSLLGLLSIIKHTRPFEDIEKAYLEAQTVIEQVEGQQNMTYANNTYQLARHYRSYGDHAKALIQARKARELYQLLVGRHHNLYIKATRTMALTLLDKGEYVKAQTSTEELLSLNQDETEVPFLFTDLARAMAKQGNYSKALEKQDDALKLYERHFGRDNRYTLIPRLDKAQSLVHLGRLQEGKILVKKTQELAKQKQRPDHHIHAHANAVLGFVLYNEGDVVGAEGLLKEALPILREKRGEKGRETRETLEWLALCAEARGDAKAAERWRSQ